MTELNTEQHAWTSSRPPGHTAAVLSPVCGCGQDLDHCSRAYCPRCGTHIAGHAA